MSNFQQKGTAQSAQQQGKTIDLSVENQQPKSANTNNLMKNKTEVVQQQSVNDRADQQMQQDQQQYSIGGLVIGKDWLIGFKQQQDVKKQYDIYMDYVYTAIVLQNAIEDKHRYERTEPDNRVPIKKLDSLITRLLSDKVPLKYSNPINKQEKELSIYDEKKAFKVYKKTGSFGRILERNAKLSAQQLEIQSEKGQPVLVPIQQLNVAIEINPAKQSQVEELKGSDLRTLNKKQIVSSIGSSNSKAADKALPWSEKEARYRVVFERVAPKNSGEQSSKVFVCYQEKITDVRKITTFVQVHSIFQNVRQNMNSFKFLGREGFIKILEDVWKWRVCYKIITSLQRSSYQIQTQPSLAYSSNTSQKEQASLSMTSRNSPAQSLGDTGDVMRELQQKKQQFGTKALQEDSDFKQRLQMQMQLNTNVNFGDSQELVIDNTSQQQQSSNDQQPVFARQQNATLAQKQR